MKKKILVHIGYPKTGSSTLQHNFFPNIKESFFLGGINQNIKIQTCSINSIILF